MRNRIPGEEDIFPAFETMLGDPERFGFEQCKETPDLICHVGNKNHYLFMVYCLKRGDIGEACGIFISNGMIEDKLSFNFVYSVHADSRGKGVGRKFVEQVLGQFIHDMKNATIEPKIDSLYIETCVDINNLVSQKISRRFISTSPTIIRDSISGKPQFHYKRLVVLTQ